MRLWLMLLAVAALCAATVIGCSSSGGSGPDDTGDPPAEGAIGPTGGDVELDGQARLSVPAGALGDTVDFTIEENDQPASPPQGMDLCSDCVTIGPSGTTFTVPATVTVTYDPGDLGGADESDVILYTDDGRGWTALTTSVDESENEASADVDHLSDFAAMVDTTSTGPQADGVFAALKLQRGMTYIEFAGRDSMVIKSDFLSAWLDSTVAICAPQSPIMADSVWCENAQVYELQWEPVDTMYRYAQLFPNDFLVEGHTYTYHVEGVPNADDLVVSIEFPESSPYIVDPVNQATVSLSGFTVTWEGHDGSGDVNLGIVPATGSPEDGVYVVTPNDGSHTFSSGDLSGVPSGGAAIVLNYFNYENIDETGYDSESYIEAKVTHGVVVTLQ